MLELKIPEITELWDEKNQCFEHVKAQTIQMEHSLIAISKWEAKWHISFLEQVRRELLTNEQLMDYIRCMTITHNVDDIVFRSLQAPQIKQITDYINNPATATTFSNENQAPNFEILTSEIIYWEMIALGIWKECEKWNINRLVTLIHVCNNKNKKAQPMPVNKIQSQNAMVNALRRKRYNTRG